MHRIPSKVVVLLLSLCPTLAQTSLSVPPPTIVTLGSPTYPPMAVAARVSGDVNLSVTVATDGAPVSVTVVSGPPMLRQAAIESAKASRFWPSAGVYPVIYKFVLDLTMKCGEERDSSYPHVKYEANVITVAEQSVLLCDPAAVIERVRSAKCLYLWKCGSKVQ